MRVPVPKFDEAINFIVAKPVRLRGIDLKPGDPLPPGLEIRKQRQLFDARYIKAAPVKVAIEPPLKPKEKK